VNSKPNGKVMALFHALHGKDGRFEIETIEIDAQGIIGDKYYGKNPDRTILITSDDASYGLAASQGIKMPFGSLGENIVIDINPYHLCAGQKIRIGETVVAVTQNCTLCSSLGKVDEKLPELLKDDRGIFVKTVQSGKIRKGDSVSLL
jgi:MOSC domain-containing protein YiiM